MTVIIKCQNVDYHVYYVGGYAGNQYGFEIRITDKISISGTGYNGAAKADVAAQAIGNKYALIMRDTTEWNYCSSPKDSMQYTVAYKYGAVDILFADPDAANGWSNHDTWEDWDRVVIAWKPRPDHPSKGAK